jgi:hypothetical protein
MNRSRLAAVFAIQVIVFAGLAGVALDLYAHKRLETLAGLNLWGYRGVVAHQRQPREIRLVVVGGTRAFGLGMPASWTIATVVRQEVMLVTDRPGGVVRQVVALTLARPGALPDSYTGTIEHFAYLKPDYICIYDDLGVGGAPLPEETSGVFARTGYWPALPLALQEKGMLWRFGSVQAGYVRTASPGTSWMRRVSGTALQGAGIMLAGVDRMMARPAIPHRADDPERYAAQMMQTLGVALNHARGVVVALGPAESPLQASNLAALLPRLDNELRTTPRLRLVNLQADAVLRDPSQRLDGWNYGGEAIATAARAIAPSVVELIALADRGAAASR